MIRTANEFSRQLYQLAHDVRLTHTVGIEYPDHSKKTRADQPVETMTIEVSDDVDRDGYDITVVVKEFTNKNTTIDVEWVRDEEEDDATFDASQMDEREEPGTVFDDAFDYIEGLVTPKKVGGQPKDAPPEDVYAIKLHQHAVVNGLQTTQLAWLDVNAPVSTGSFTHQIALAYVGTSLHIVDMDRFLHALNFGEHIHNVYTVPKHQRLSRLGNALKKVLQDRPNLKLRSQGQLTHETEGNVAFVFQMLLEEGVVLNGIIPTVMPPDLDGDEEEEVGD